MLLLLPPVKRRLHFLTTIFILYLRNQRIICFLPNIPTSVHNSLGDIELQTDDVFEILKILNTTKASGPDGFSPRVL